MMSEDPRCIPQLLSDALAQASKLFSAEVELARAEASEKLSEFARGAIFVALGLVVVIPALVMLLMTIAVALVGGGFSPMASYLIVAIGAFLFAGAAIAVGMSRFTPDRLALRATLEQLRRDRTAARELMQ